MQKTSLHIKTIGTIILIFSVVTAVYTTLSFFVRKHSRLANLKDTGLMITERAGLSLTQPLWNIDYEIIQEIIDAEMQDLNVYAIILDDYSTQKQLGAYRTTEGVIKNEFPKILPQGTLSCKKIIYKNHYRLGELTVYLTNSVMLQELYLRSLTELLYFVVIITIAILMLFVVFSIYIFTPLAKIQQGVEAMSNSELSHATTISLATGDEFEVLATSFNQMNAHIGGLIGKLQAAHANLNTILENTDNVIWSIDKNKQIIYANSLFIATAESVFNFEGELSTDGSFSILRYTEYWEDLIERVFTGETIFVEFGKKLRDKEHFFESTLVPIHAENKEISGAAIFVRDITQRKIAEDEVKTTKKYLDNIINSMPSVIIGVDPDGAVVHWNKAAETRTGIDMEHAKGQKLFALLPEYERVLNDLSIAIAENKTLIKEKQLVNEKNINHYEDIMIYPLVANGIKGAVLKIDDITDKVRFNTMLIQSEKMITVAGLASGMAHEINNPLGIITQSIQNTQRRLSPTVESNKAVASELNLDLDAVSRYLEKRRIYTYLSAIHDAVLRASKIITNMVNFSRKSESKIYPNSLTKIINETLELAENEYDIKKNYDFKKIRITKELDDSLAEIPLIKAEIEQVLINLLKNATFALSQKSARQQFSPEIRISTIRETGYAVIRISDNGVGLTEQIKERIFEPFFTTMEAGSGTGLGLSIAYYIITEDHEGTIDVESTENEGTTFIIRLPLTH